MIMRFVDWWEKQPMYKAVWFLPIIFLLLILAKIFSLFKRSKDNGNYIQGSISNQDK